MAAIRFSLTSDEVAWVEDVLSNDENSDDAELAKYFVRGGLTQAQAEAVLCRRGSTPLPRTLQSRLTMSQGECHEQTKEVQRGIQA